MSTKSFLFLFFCILSFRSYPQTSILPDDKKICYTGRIAFDDPLNPSFSMSATGIKINFEGTKVDGRFSSQGGSSFVYIIIDGVATPYDRKIVEFNNVNESLYTLADNLSDGAHTLELIKLNESDTKITFHGFVITGKGLISKPKRPVLQLEFIGDSNTAGWAAWDAYDKGGNEASGSFYTFPGLTSRMLNAEYSLIGASSSGVADRATWNLTKCYNRIHLKDKISPINTWNFSNNYWDFEPQAVIINLGANDHYPKTPKEEIKAAWKQFITNQIRVHYPNAHIVLANSYGWSYGEPADYVHEAINELKAKGDDNVSFVKFPWLWGQTHAVINEHAGFANILALHLSKELNLPTPQLSPLSSMGQQGELKNGSFEHSILPGIADGWRPHGKNKLITNQKDAFKGTRFMRLTDGGWVNFATPVSTGTTLNLKAYMRGLQDDAAGYLKIIFKDQGQKTIKTQQIRPDINKEWTAYETSVVVPKGVWSAWIIIEADEDSEIDFDAVSLKMSK